MDDDPEMLAMECVSFLNYAEAKSHFDMAENPEDLKAWQNSPTMDAVKRNKFDLHRERMEERGQVVAKPKKKAKG